jgi:hypothetical protein
MTKAEKPKYYDRPEPHLQQGDVFRLNLVGPSADEEARVFRSEDGRHGSVVFEKGCQGRVFGLRELQTLLDATVPRADLHTAPFQLTRDGQGEMVIVYARLFRYFIIATHTCDISGIDKKRPLPWATILPVFTLAETCRNERFPLKSLRETSSIQDFLTQKTELASELVGALELGYADRIRGIVRSWIKSGLTGDLLKDAQWIQNYLMNYHTKGILFSLPGDEDFSLPESYVDFSAAFTVATTKLEALKDCRFVRVAEPYRMAFGKAFADLISRPTLPAAMRPRTPT